MSDKSQSTAQLLPEIKQLREELTMARSIIAKADTVATLKNQSSEFEIQTRVWIENSPVCTKIVDMDFNLQYMSSSGIKDLKIDDITDYYGRPYPLDFYPNSFKTPMLSNLKKVKATGETITQESYIKDAHENKIWYRSTLVPVRDENNQIETILVVSMNISAQKQAEEKLKHAFETVEMQIVKRTTELKKSEERFSFAMNGANDGLWDWNIETDEVYYSSRWKNMLGYEESELEDKLDTWALLVHPDDKDRILGATQDYISGRTDSFEVEMRMLHKDGHEVFILSRAFLVDTGSDDEPVRMVGTHVDITKRKQEENFAERNAEILEMIATGRVASEIYDAIALMYEERHPGLRCSMLELHGNKLMHGGAPSMPKEYCDAVNGLENGPSVGSCGTSTYWGKRVLVESIDTDPKWAKIKHVALPHGMRCCWSEPIKNSTGKVLGAFGMYYNHTALPNEAESRDLTSAARLAGIIMERVHSDIELNQHRLKLEEQVAERTAELQDATKIAKEASQAKGLFLANMSHEIRTPLNAVLGLAKMGSRGDTVNQGKETFENIYNSGKHLLTIINDILDFSKIEAGKLSIETLPFQLFATVESSVNYIFAKAQDKGLKISINLQPNLPDYVLGDPNRIQQILLNLLSNAVKFTKKGSITISVSRNEDETQITVQDQGIGLNEEQVSRLFTPFEQADKSTTRNFGGTGLGLTISYNLAQMMGGYISVESQVNIGSTFTLTLPLAKTDSPQTMETVIQEPEGENPSLTGIRILAAEDIEINRIVLESTLILEGASVEFTENGQQTIDHLMEAGIDKFDVVLMDVQMPVMDGYEATRRILEIAPDLPIIGVTAHALKEEHDKCHAAGMVCSITKPVDDDALITTILKHAIRR